MGGKVFTSGPAPLSTPRMPPELYYTRRDYYISLLAAYYDQAATPIEAPCKTSFGDIDILVSQPKSPSLDRNTLLEALDAVEAFSTAGSPTTSFAVPYPGLQHAYIQVDVRVCPSGSFGWQLFHQSHGDMWNLLGTAIRPLGLTANDVGLHVRIPDIEKFDRKRGMVFLTNEPDAVLGFLGLDRDKYARPFESVEALYQFVVRFKWFSAEVYVRDGLKANDRKRMVQRDLYRRFVDQWLPKNQSIFDANWEPRVSRDDVQGLALSIFKKREKFEECIQIWRRDRKELLEKQQIRLKRKADAVKLDEYAGAWMKWLERGRPMT